MKLLKKLTKLFQPRSAPKYSVRPIDLFKQADKLSDYEREEVVEALKKSFFVQNALRYNEVVIYTNECEKWNNYTDPTDGTVTNDPDVPRADGTYEIEGHSCVDVNAHVKFRYSDPRHWWLYIRRMAKWVSELDWFSDWKYRPDFFKLDGWVFVVSSFSSYKSEAMEAINDYETWPQPHWRVMTKESFEKSLAAVTDREVVLLLSQTHTRIGSGMWVQKTDPTCMVVDDRLYKYDLKDGWSFKEIAHLIDIWFKLLYDWNNSGRVSVDIKVKEE